jgi:hypothetical protein
MLSSPIQTDNTRPMSTQSQTPESGTSSPQEARQLQTSRASLNLSEEVTRLEEARLEAIRKMVKRTFETVLGEAQNPSINALARAVTNIGETVSEATQQNEQLRSDLQKAGKRAGRRTWWTVLAATSLVLIAIGALWWKIAPPPALPGAPTLEQIRTQQSQFDRLTLAVAAEQEEQRSREEEISRLDARIERDQAAITTMAGSMAALSASRQQAQDDLASLQRLNQQFQFRLLQMDGQNGPQVVIQIPPNAQQVTVDGKYYLILTPPQQQPQAPQSTQSTQSK